MVSLKNSFFKVKVAKAAKVSVLATLAMLATLTVENYGRAVAMRSDQGSSGHQRD